MLKINKPCTVYIKFTFEVPRKFVLTNNEGKIYYFRYLKGQYPRIKFNIVHPGNYFSDTAFEVVKISSLEIPDNLPDLPEPERNRFKDFKIVDNFSLVNTPARIFTGSGIIEVSREFYEYPEPIRVFILLHEIGHFHYGITEADKNKALSMGENGEKWLKNKSTESEMKCDLFALVEYLKMGYNRSMAFYSLSHVLKMNNENQKRLKTLISNIQKTQTNEIK